MKVLRLGLTNAPIGERRLPPREAPVPVGRSPQPHQRGVVRRSGRQVARSGGSVAFSGSNTVAASYDATDLNLDDLHALRRAGIGVFVWTVNDEKAMRALIDAGVTGIITDFPQTLTALLR